MLASGGEVIEVVGGPPNPLCAEAPPDLKPDPSDNARSLAFRFRLGKFDFLDCGDLTWNVEKSPGLPGRPDRPDRPLPGDAPRHGDLEPSDPGPDDRADGGHHEQRPAQGGRRRRRSSCSKSIPSIQAAYQLHKNAATGAAENTDPALIANTDPAGGQFIHVAVTPDGASFTVQIGTDGPARTFDSR